MLDCKSMATPMDTNLKLLSDETSKLVDMTQYRQIIGSLMYLMNTRPNICFVVDTLSQYLAKPRSIHLIAAKHVMYLKGTIDLDFTMVEIMTTDYMDVRIQIGKEVPQTGRTPQVDVIVWDPP